MAKSPRQKKLTASEMNDRLSDKVYNWESPRSGKYQIQYTEDGRWYTFNQSLYEVCYKCKAITRDEYDLFCANDQRVVNSGLAFKGDS